MLNFELYNPVNYVFGKGQIEKLTELVPSNTKILIAYGGGSIFKNGVYDQVKAALPNHDIVEFGGIEPNPRFETLMKAVEIIRAEQIGFILAVGGGSVIDGVKFISAAVNFCMIYKLLVNFTRIKPWIYKNIMVLQNDFVVFPFVK